MGHLNLGEGPGIPWVVHGHLGQKYKSMEVTKAREGRLYVPESKRYNICNKRVDCQVGETTERENPPISSHYNHSIVFCQTSSRVECLGVI